MSVIVKSQLSVVDWEFTGSSNFGFSGYKSVWNYLVAQVT